MHLCILCMMCLVFFNQIQLFRVVWRLAKSYTFYKVVSLIEVITGHVLNTLFKGEFGLPQELQVALLWILSCFFFICVHHICSESFPTGQFTTWTPSIPILGRKFAKKIAELLASSQHVEAGHEFVDGLFWGNTFGVES